MIEKEDRRYAELALESALKEGATDARVTLSKSQTDIVSTLDGEIDSVSECLDRSISISVFAFGRFGTFSTDKLEEDAVKAFVKRAVQAVSGLAPDPFRRLPERAATERNAVSGRELGLYDEDYPDSTPERRRKKALEASITPRKGEGWELISEEGEYCETLEDELILDSQGLECRHTETSFEYSVEMTVLGADGGRYTGFWWEAASDRKSLDTAACGETALRRAVAAMNPQNAGSGKYTMVVENDCASKLLSPILHALSGYAIQQSDSFLVGSLGRQMFSEALTIDERGRESGPGARLFDSEGVATPSDPIIEGGVVRKYFINTYMSGKMEMSPTYEGAMRPALRPWPEKGLDRDAIIAACGDGILVTGFNGGNHTASTGNFSYGVEGFRIKDGRIAGPIDGMLITGNFLTLWKNLIYVGSDPRECLAKLVPTLAFKDVDFAG